LKETKDEGAQEGEMSREGLSVGLQPPYVSRPLQVLPLLRHKTNR